MMSALVVSRSLYRMRLRYVLTVLRLSPSSAAISLNPHPGSLLLELPQQFERPWVRDRQVQEQHVSRRRTDLGDELCAARNIAHDTYVRALGEDALPPLEHDRAVIGQEQLDHRRLQCRSSRKRKAPSSRIAGATEPIPAPRMSSVHPSHAGVPESRRSGKTRHLAVVP